MHRHLAPYINKYNVEPIVQGFPIVIGVGLECKKFLISEDAVKDFGNAADCCGGPEKEGVSERMHTKSRSLYEHAFVEIEDMDRRNATHLIPSVEGG